MRSVLDRVTFIAKGVVAVVRDASIGPRSSPNVGSADRPEQKVKRRRRPLPPIRCEVPSSWLSDATVAPPLVAGPDFDPTRKAEVKDERLPRFGAAEREQDVKPRVVRGKSEVGVEELADGRKLTRRAVKYEWATGAATTVECATWEQAGGDVEALRQLRASPAANGQERSPAVVIAAREAITDAANQAGYDAVRFEINQTSAPGLDALRVLLGRPVIVVLEDPRFDLQMSLVGDRCVALGIEVSFASIHKLGNKDLREALEAARPWKQKPPVSRPAVVDAPSEPLHLRPPPSPPGEAPGARWLFRQAQERNALVRRGSQLERKGRDGQLAPEERMELRWLTRRLADTPRSAGSKEAARTSHVTPTEREE